MHLQPVFKDYKLFSSLEKESVSEDLFNRGICLPSDTKMSKEDLTNIVHIIKHLSIRVKSIRELGN